MEIIGLRLHCKESKATAMELELELKFMALLENKLEISEVEKALNT